MLQKNGGINFESEILGQASNFSLLCFVSKIKLSKYSFILPFRESGYFSIKMMK